MARHRVAVLALDGVTALDMSIATQVFRARPETSYEVLVCAATERVTTTSGFEVVVSAGLKQALKADTVIVPGYEPVLQPPPEAVLETLAKSRAGGRRVVSICTGAFALAAAGVLDGLHATTHWQHIDALAREFPAIHTDRDVLYVDEGDVLTSAGVCCGIDLCLHIVRRDLGAAAANHVARVLVAAPHRDGGQAQYVPTTVTPTTNNSLADTREWALRNLESPLTISELARHAGLSERSLIRRFTSETGMPPLQWLNHARVGAARELLEVTDHSMDRVASGCGLGTAANLRLHFRRTLQTTPTSYRRTFQRKSAATA